MPRINAKIQNANIELNGGEDEDAKETLHRYKKMLDSTERLNAVKALLYRGEYDIFWRSKEFPKILLFIKQQSLAWLHSSAIN